MQRWISVSLVIILCACFSCKKENTNKITNNSSFFESAAKSKAEAEVLKEKLLRVSVEVNKYLDEGNDLASADKQMSMGKTFFDKNEYPMAIQCYDTASIIYKDLLTKTPKLEKIFSYKKQISEYKKDNYPQISEQNAEYLLSVGELDKSIEEYSVIYKSYKNIKPQITTFKEPTSAAATNDKTNDIDKAKQEYELAYSKADIDLINKYASTNLKEIYNKVEQAAKKQGKEGAVLYREAVKLLEIATKQATTERNTILLQDLVKDLQATILNKEKWEAEDILEQIQQIDPNYPDLLKYKNKVAAMKGPAKNLTIYLQNKVKMEFVLVRPGKFLAGKDQIQVVITKPFYIGKYEVTQEQWNSIMPNNPSKEIGVNKPVNNVRWEDCQTFIRTLSNKITGKEFALPTEAQWEYACRGGLDGARFCYGDSEDTLPEYAWYNGDAVHDVGLKKPNKWGLFDMHGNVWEWCQDWYGDKYPYSSTDPQGPEKGSRKVARGGSAFTRIIDTRISDKLSCSGHWGEDKTDQYFGFRLIIQLK